MKQALLFLLIVFICVQSETVNGLYGLIVHKPHSICDFSGPRIEIEGKSFFSIPELYEGRFSATIPVFNGSFALAFSSIWLDSVYGELSGAGTVGQRFGKFSVGTNLSLNWSDMYGVDRVLATSISSSFACLISKNVETFIVLPMVKKSVHGEWLCVDRWCTGIKMRHDSLRMDIGVELIKKEYSKVAMQLLQSWQPHDNLFLYGSVLSNPLKVSFGIAIQLQKIVVGVFYESHHSLGSVKTAKVGYLKENCKVRW